MEIPRLSRRRLGVAGILAAIILFAMIFTAGLGFFLFQQNLSHIYDQANIYSQNQIASRTNQQLTITAHPVQGGTSSGTMLSAVLANVGGNSSSIIEFFVRDQNGQLICLSPKLGSVPSCVTSIVVSKTLSLNVLSPSFVLAAGGNLNVTTGWASNNASLTNCSTAAICSVNLVTAVGNVFVGGFPLANPQGVSITTNLNATTIAPGHHVQDGALLSGVTNSAGGTVTYSWFNDGACGAFGGVKTSLLPPVVVTNGKVPNSKAQNFTIAGYYSFQAIYSGDAANSGATSACEPLNVNTPGQCVTNLAVSPPVICQATVAQGLGSLAFDFDSYKWYSSGACSPQGPSPLAVIGQNPQSSCTLKDGLAGAFSVKNAPRAYTISQTGMSNSGTNLWFSINVTNADPGGRTLVFDQYTQAWYSWFCPEVIGGNGPCAPGPHGQLSSTYYGFVTVSSGGVSSTSTPAMTVPYGKTATVFFGLQESDAGTLPGVPLCGFSGSLPSTSMVTPAFVFFHGTVGGLTWGLDFPLAATLWTNIGGSC